MKGDIMKKVKMDNCGHKATINITNDDSVINTNQSHNSKKEALGPNTKR